MADKTVSLNERERLKEAAEQEARRKERDAELKTRKPSDEKIYDLTIKDGQVIMTNELTLAESNAPRISSTTSSLDTSPAQVWHAQGSTTNGPPGTNGLTAADGSVTPLAPPEPPSPEEKAPLEEAERILMDYIGMLHSGSALTADQSVKQ